MTNRPGTLWRPSSPARADPADKTVAVSDYTSAEHVGSSLGRTEPAALNARSFTAWPAWVDLSTDIVQYGPDIPTEADLRLLGSLENKRVLELGCGGGPNAVA